MQIRLNIIILLLLNVALFGTVGCHKRPAEHQALPEKIPTPPEVRFTTREEGWPPRPQGRANVADVPWTARLAALTESREAELRNAATQDTRVRSALGARFGYVTAAEVEPDKQHAGEAADALPVRLTFYSYTNNVAVEVLMRQGAVEEVTRRGGYQPPEGADEIKAAIVLAQQDSRLATLVKGMHATAIVTYPERGQPGYGHRVLHVSFSANAAEEEAPRYYALVDLTEQKIVTAGPVGER
jgi:hypothetical protein